MLGQDRNQMASRHMAPKPMMPSAAPQTSMSGPFRCSRIVSSLSIDSFKSKRAVGPRITRLKPRPTPCRVAAVDKALPLRREGKPTSPGDAMVVQMHVYPGVQGHDWG